MNPRMESLLSWATAQPASETRRNFDPNAVDPKWYEALFGVPQESDADKMNRWMTALRTRQSQEGKPVDKSAAQELLRQLHFVCELTENANDMPKQDEGRALATLLDIALTYEDLESRTEALSVIATCAQNNPEFQQRLVELEAVPRLVRALAENAVSPAVRGKTWTALSASVRQCVPATRQFVESDGVRQLAADLNSSNPSIRRRVVFFLTFLVHHKLVSFERLEDVLPLLQQAIPVATQSDDIDLLEKLLACLLECTKVFSQHARALRERLRTDISALDRVMSRSDDVERVSEVRRLCKSLSRASS
ncbi:MAG: hypothetical protein MHM6MM_001928 [Cercozoa sp. M6MM]